MTLGDKVSYTEIYIRSADLDSTRLIWAPLPTKKTTGILAGIRTVSDGKMKKYFGDFGVVEGEHYSPTRHKKAAIVYFHLYRRPVLVPFDNLVEVE